MSDYGGGTNLRIQGTEITERIFKPATEDSMPASILKLLFLFYQSFGQAIAFNEIMIGFPLNN